MIGSTNSGRSHGDIEVLKVDNAAVRTGSWPSWSLRGANQADVDHALAPCAGPPPPREGNGNLLDLAVDAARATPPSVRSVTP